MININTAILIALYYMVFGVAVSSYCRRIVPPKDYKEDLVTTALVIVWPLIVTACLAWFLEGFIKKAISLIKPRRY